jgi:hypothetical protein
MVRKKGNSFLLIHILALYLLGMSNFASAADGPVVNPGNYRIIKGQQYTLCQDFLKNLALFPEEQPMVCDRQYHPSMKKFQKPEWERVDAREYQSLLKQMYLMFSTISSDSLEYSRELYEKRWEQYAGGAAQYGGLTLEQRLDQEIIRIWRGFFDIVHEGQKQVVLQVIFFPSCDASAKYYAGRFQSNYAYYVLNTSEELDRDYWPLAGSPGDIVFYENMIRIVQWSNGLQQSVSPTWPHGGILVSDARSRRREQIRPGESQRVIWGREVCGFEYVTRREKRGINQ